MIDFYINYVDSECYKCVEAHFLFLHLLALLKLEVSSTEHYQDLLEMAVICGQIIMLAI